MNNSVVSVAGTLNGEPSSITSSSLPIDFLKPDQRKLITGMYKKEINNYYRYCIENRIIDDDVLEVLSKKNDHHFLRKIYSLNIKHSAVP